MQALYRGNCTAIRLINEGSKREFCAVVNGGVKLGQWSGGNRAEWREIECRRLLSHGTSFESGREPPLAPGFKCGSSSPNTRHGSGSLTGVSARACRTGGAIMEPSRRGKYKVACRFHNASAYAALPQDHLGNTRAYGAHRD
jgi:hypothetical protein